MNHGAQLLRRDLRTKIETAIGDSASSWSDLINNNREDSSQSLPLAIKYVPSAHAARYKGTNLGLFIGSKNFTWGRAVYVAGIQEPLSTAIYGRAGVLAHLVRGKVDRVDPPDWRAFDARKPKNQQLYLQWLNVQRAYAKAVLTVDSEYWLQELRNEFRAQFHIDVVLFRPDEMDVDNWYTTATDTWMAISDWTDDGSLKTDYSTRFSDARLTILIEEEFVSDNPPRQPPLTRIPQLAISRASPAPMNLPTRARNAYRAKTIERVLS